MAGHCYEDKHYFPNIQLEKHCSWDTQMGTHFLAGTELQRFSPGRELHERCSPDKERHQRFSADREPDKGCCRGKESSAVSGCPTKDARTADMKRSNNPDDVISQSRRRNRNGLRPHQGYLGLRNEGSTCYMNSILQCLFMTPDFTNNILSRIGEAPLSDHVSVFQELFLKLQYGFSPPSPLHLMHCFDIQEGRQQDVEEHFRILINSLPPEIQQLFRIQMVHSLTCSGCEREEVMQNDMLCLPLAVKDQNPSVDGALCDFQESNKLDLDNQSYCSKCRRKEDAISRHYFKALPKILVVHLKRYEIYQGRFEKITRSVSVPYSLTVPVDKSQEAAAQDRRHEVTTTDEKKAPEYPPIDYPDYPVSDMGTQQRFNTVDQWGRGERQQHKHQANAVGTRQDFNPVDQWGREERQQHKHQANAVGTRQDFNTVDQWGRGERQQHKHQDSVKYTLFAHCNHYGGLRSGHYSAEIMSCDDNKWYTFNDTQVTKGSKSKKKEIHSNSAYLLMYYQEQENPKFLEYDDLPLAIQKRIQSAQYCTRSLYQRPKVSVPYAV